MTTLKDGDVILCHANNFSTWYRWLFSHLIRWIDGVYYNHAQIIYNGKIYEADLKVRITDVIENKGDNVLILRPKRDLSANELSLLRDFLEKETGKPYGFAAVIFWQTLYILSGRRIWLGHDGAQADDKPYCTEFVTRAYNKMRGYYPTYYKTAPSGMINDAALYFDVVFEGKF